MWLEALLPREGRFSYQGRERVPDRRILSGIFLTLHTCIRL